MHIEFRKGSEHYDYIWKVCLHKGEQGQCNGHEEWIHPGRYGIWYRTGDETLVEAIYEINDPNAEMDSDEFTDWTLPISIIVCTGTDDHDTIA